MALKARIGAKDGRKTAVGLSTGPSDMRLLLARTEHVGSRLRRSRSIFVAHRKRETLGILLKNHMSEPLVLENRHTGERLELRRVLVDGDICLELRGSLPARSEGPPLHVHLKEREEGIVTRGRLTAVVDGRRIEVGPGETAELPLGSAHRWWNEGDEPVEFVGYARPVVDLDRYLQAVFEVVNAGPAGRPSPMYMAHVLRRHRGTQEVRLMPAPLQALFFRVAHLVGSLTGAYKGEGWPGCPSRCSGAPAAAPGDT